jgi:uncharacterized protein YvpB
LLKKHAAFLVTVTLSSLLFGASVSLVAVSGWSNGGFSADPSNPDYGTHDWIAQHALDWLPLEEKQFILNNIANYLYGTELPDNGTVPGGIGDKTKHHVYYFANGSLQDDASAVRAQEEYGKAVKLFKAGGLANAAKTLGVMTHYIADVAVFGHVMGSETDWGNETHHSDYETYVNARTNNYTDEFNTFLAFDGDLSEIFAYHATLTLANDTTFDGGGGLTCVWMDENYNWSDSTFKNRCGESLNFAVNLVADVLHTFYLDVHGIVHLITVPFHYQDVDYYCGPACLEMVFDYYGDDINQFEIADVARTIGEPVYSTFTDELRRAAHFSNISTSMGDEIHDKNITGYTLRKLGYSAFEAFNMDLTQLKSYIDEDKPLILLMWYSSFHVSTHYRVVTGYNETHIFLHDPWNKPEWGGMYGSAYIAFNYTAFLDLWSYYGYWALYTSPWTINVSAPTYVKPETPFQINATIAYPQSLPNTLDNYPASSCNATITLPVNANLTLAQGEILKKTLGTGFLQAGANSTASWMVIANSSISCNVTIEVEGLISGSVWAHSINYTAYDYSDRIGAQANFTLELNEDSNSPIIGIPSRVPEDDVQPNQQVTVFVNVTDAESGVKNVTLYYNLNNSLTWATKPMSYNSTSCLYNATILGQPIGTYVRFIIVAYDKVGNNATGDGTEYCTYQVVPEFPLSLILPLFMVLAIPAILYVKKKALRKTKI